MLKLYNTINIFISYRYTDYLQNVIDIVKNHCQQYHIFYTDAYLRINKQNNIVPECQLSIVVCDETCNDRYKCQADWLNTWSQHFRNTKTLALIFGVEKDWINYKMYIQFDLQLQILLETIDDEYNINQLNTKLIQFFK
jgi:hypothetical protein